MGQLRKIREFICRNESPRPKLQISSLSSKAQPYFN